MSLYGDYIKEREDFDIIEDWRGFASYRIDGPVCYIRDIYIKPDQRKTKVHYEFSDKIVEIAKERGCTKLLGTVDPNDKAATRNIKVLLGYGLQFMNIHNQLMWFSKEI